MHLTRKVTLQDVADRAGVSLTTASRVVNEGSRRVGPRLAQRVNQAVAELGYTANLQARAVATGQSTMVGVVVHDIADPYFSSIAAGLIEVADARRLLVCISSTAATEAAEREYVALMRAQRARAVILIGSRSDDTAAREALRAEIARSPAPAAGPWPSARTCSAWTRCCRRTPRAPRRWPGPWWRSGTAASPCWPGRVAC